MMGNAVLDVTQLLLPLRAGGRRGQPADPGVGL